MDSLSDEELLKSLKKYDSAIGPVIDTTRNLYKRKLKSYILKSNTAESQEFSDQDGKAIYCAYASFRLLFRFTAPTDY